MLFAQVVIHHAVDDRTLAIRNRVEDLANLMRVLNRDLDRMGVLEAVFVESGKVVVGDILRPGLPGRKAVIGGFRSHVGGEAFIEPQVGPPLHGGVIAEPLVGQLMVNHVGDALAGSLGRVLLVDEHSSFAIGDQAPVFHGTGGEIGQSDHVELGEAVRDAKPIGEICQRMTGLLESKAGLLLFPWAGPNANRDAVSVLGFQRI